MQFALKKSISKEKAILSLFVELFHLHIPFHDFMD